jgi:WD40 repeat protein
VRLSQAVEWRDRSRPRLNELERAFLDASVALEKHEADDRDRRRRRTIVGLTASLAVFAVLAGLAGVQWRLAVREGQIALARQLGAQAVLMRSQPGMQLRRLALAAEGMSRLDAVGASSFDVDLALRGELAGVPRHVMRRSVEYWHDDVRLSSDGAHLIVGHFTSLDATVVATASGAEVVRFEGGPAGAFSATRAGKTIPFRMEGGMARNHMVAWSADGRYVLTEAYDGTRGAEQVWDTETGKELLRLDLAESGPYELSANGRYLAVSTPGQATSLDKTGRRTEVWDVQAGRKISGSAPGDVRGLADDGKVMATGRGLWAVGDELRPLASWDVNTWYVVLARDGGHAAIWVERNGKRQIEVWSTSAGASPTILATDDPIGVLLALSPDGRYVILRTEANEETQVRDVAGKSIVARTTVPTLAAAVSPSGEYRLAGPHAGDNAVDVWTLERAGGAALGIALDEPIVAAGVSALGVVTTITQDGGTLTIRARDVKTGRDIPDHGAQVAGKNAVFAPDGRTFAVMRDSGLEVRRVGAADAVATFAFASPSAAVWSPDGRCLAAQHEGEVRAWDLSDRRSLGQLAMPQPPTVLALGSGCESLAAVVSSGRVTRSGVAHYAKVWRVATAEELTSFELAKDRSIRTDTHCALSPDAKYMVTANLTVVEMTSGTTRVQLGVDPSTTTNCVITADGRYLATGSPEGVRLWELTSGKEAFRLPTGDRPLALDQESRYLATIGDDNTVRVWFLRRADLIDQACQRLPRNLSVAEWSEYVGDDAYRKTCPDRP